MPVPSACTAEGVKIMVELQLDKPRDSAKPPHPRPGTLTATRLKVITAPMSNQRAVLHIRLPGRTVTADIAVKSLRKAQSAIREAGADNLAFVLGPPHRRRHDRRGRPLRTAEGGKTDATMTRHRNQSWARRRRE
jgi:hypothetical protein